MSRPKSASSWLITMMMPEPNTYPARIGRERNSLMKPSRATNPRTHHPPTNSATNAASSAASSGSTTRGATAAAAMMATVDSAPMLRSRQVPKTAYAARAPIAAYNPWTEGTPASVA